MNKELKKYIKENLKKYQKRKSIIKILLFPITFLLSFFKNKLSDLYSCDEIVSIDEKSNKEKNKSKSNKYFYSIEGVHFDDEEIFDKIKNENTDIKSDTSSDYEIPAFLRSRKDINIEQYIEENNKYNDFQTLLFKMIDERNLIDSEVYNKVHIDRRLFSKIRTDKEYHPSKETIILLALSMELSELELEKLLDSASYSLPRNNHYDLIIRFCFMKGIYKITEVNDLLEQYNCKLFNY